MCHFCYSVPLVTTVVEMSTFIFLFPIPCFEKLESCSTGECGGRASVFRTRGSPLLQYCTKLSSFTSTLFNPSQSPNAEMLAYLLLTVLSYRNCPSYLLLISRLHFAHLIAGLPTQTCKQHRLLLRVINCLFSLVPSLPSLLSPMFMEWATILMLDTIFGSSCSQYS